MSYHFDERQLYLKLIERDPVVLREFVESNYKQLKKSLHFSEVTPDEHEDIIQESFAVFFNSLKSFKKQSKLSTYLWGIFYNKLRETRRKYGKTPTPVAEIYENLFEEDGHWLQGLHISDPETWENYSEMSQIITDCLEKLPFIHKQILIAQTHSNMSKEDICHNLDINDTNYRQSLSRGRKSLRNCVDRSFQGIENA